MTDEVPHARMVGPGTDIWDQAQQTMAMRSAAYGPGTETLQGIAAGWSVIVGKQVTPRQAAKMMAWLKIVRDNRPAMDNMVDGINYLAMAHIAFPIDDPSAIEALTALNTDPDN